MKKRTTPTRRQEFEWISRLRGWIGKTSKSRFPVGVGDDAAAWLPSPGHAAVMTVDAMVESVHFRRDWLTWREVGRRAVAVSVSDLAAMGARPRCLLASVVLEDGTSTGDFSALQRGLTAAARSYDATLIGGNLSSGRMALHITAMGECLPELLVRRSGARLGDTIWVTGSPGLAALGLVSYQREMKRRVPTVLARARRAFRQPIARVKEAMHIVRRLQPHAMIDVSDGLAGDIAHILAESGARRRRPMAVELDGGALATTRGLAPAARVLGKDAVAAALYGGEDYELCFTVAAGSISKRDQSTFAKRFGIALTCVGRVVSGSESVVVMSQNSRQSVDLEGGWTHFSGHSGRRSR